MSIPPQSKDPQPDEAEFNAFFRQNSPSPNPRAPRAISTGPITHDPIRAAAASS